MIAINLIRQQPCYRREAFDAGLRKVGYRLVTDARPGGPEDLLVIWNRYGQYHQRANTWEAAGGTVLVCENGYLGHDEQGRQYYAIAAHGHNGSGWWPVGTEDRWAALNIPLQPWHGTDEQAHLLVCGQRGIGSPTMASPQNWHVNAAARLANVTKRPIRIRLHPGNHAPAIPLERDLDGAHACVIWSSGAGVKALVAGYRIFYDAPHWICEGAAARLGEFGGPVNYATDETRLAAMRRLAHAQFSVDEINAGEPFARFQAEIAQRKAA